MTFRALVKMWTVPSGMCALEVSQIFKHKFKDSSKVCFASGSWVRRGLRGRNGGHEVALVRGTWRGSTETLEDRPVTQIRKRLPALHHSWFPLQGSYKDPVHILQPVSPTPTIQVLSSAVLSSSCGRAARQADGHPLTGKISGTRSARL